MEQLRILETLSHKKTVRSMEKMDKAWALEQATRYANKYAEAREKTVQMAKQISALEETLEQAKKELQYLSKLTRTQQKYIEKLENNVSVKKEKKETTIKTIPNLKVVNDDAC